MLTFYNLFEQSYNDKVEDIKDLALFIQQSGDLLANITVFDYSANKVYLNGSLNEINCVIEDKHISTSPAFIIIDFPDKNISLKINLLDIDEHTMKRFDNKETGVVNLFVPCFKAERSINP